MNTLFAKTKSGTTINLEFVYRNEEVVCDATVGEKRMCKVSFARRDGKPYLSLTQYEVKGLLGIDTGKNANNLIEVLGGDPDEIRAAFAISVIDRLKTEAANINVTRIKFAYSTSLKYCCFSFFDGENRIADDIVKYSDFCNRFITAVKSTDTKSFEGLVIDTDMGDYSITTFYEVHQSGFSAIVETGEAIAHEDTQKKKAAKAAETAKADAIFEQAKVTGKPVILSQCFLSGNDIPRRYRDEDSDMGTLVTWANPNGTTSESFSHAY